MELMLQQLKQRLTKYHFVDVANVDLIIDEEFEFIEECFNTSISIEDVAKALIDIYMVA